MAMKLVMEEKDTRGGRGGVTKERETRVWNGWARSREREKRG